MPKYLPLHLINLAQSSVPIKPIYPQNTIEGRTPSLKQQVGIMDIKDPRKLTIRNLAYMDRGEFRDVCALFIIIDMELICKIHPQNPTYL